MLYFFVIAFLCFLFVIGIYNISKEKKNKEQENKIKAELEKERNELIKNELSEFDEIKNQFAILRKNWTNDLNQMESAIQDLCSLRDEKSKILLNFKSKATDLHLKMEKSIQLYKKSKDDSLKETYGKLALEREQIQNKIQEIESDLAEQSMIINNYLDKKKQLQKNIDHLRYQENETILNVNSLKKIQEIEKKLDSFDDNEYQKNLERVKEYNSKIKASAKVSMQLKKNEEQMIDEELFVSGANKKYKDDFNLNIKMEEICSDNQDKDKNILPNKVLVDKKNSENDIDKLFS